MATPIEELQNGINTHVPLKLMMRLYAAHILKEHNDNKVHASKVLEIDRRTLQRWASEAEAAARRSGTRT